MVLGLTYLRAIEAAGALPMVIPPLPEEAIGPLLDRLDGICLSGGPDLDPDTYGADPHPELGPTEPDLDRFELAVARRADAREMPILAICRGTQALNVARGGSLTSTCRRSPRRSPTGRRARATRRATRSRSSPAADWRRRSGTRKSRSATSSTSTPSTTRRSSGSARG